MTGSQMADFPSDRDAATVVGLVSDTHGRLRPELLDLFRGVDLILHAGDVGDPGILQRLEEVAPLSAVRGNVDPGSVRERTWESFVGEMAGLRIAVVHGHVTTDPAALAARFAGADVVVHGHTHEPRVLRREGLLIVNPGSAGPRRPGKPVTAGLLSVRDGRPEVRLVHLETGEPWRPEA
ncbi:MAG: metallophosphoesterase family protein [Gemmatimonadota bacterium]